MSVVALAAAKAFLNVQTAAQDTELQVMLDRAEATLSRRVGPLAPLPVPDEVHSGGGTTIVLRTWPVLALTSVSYAGVTVTPPDVDLDVDSGIVHGTFPAGRRNLRVSYTAGRDTLPADLQTAVLEQLKHLWESQRASTGPGFGVPADTTPAPSYLLPYRVQSLIEPFRTPAGIG